MLGKIWRRSNWVNDAVLPLLGALTWSAWGGVLLAALLDFVTDHHANLSAGLAVVLLLLGGTAAARLTADWARGRWALLFGGLAAALLAEWWLLFWPAYPLWDPAWVLSLVQQAGALAPGPLLVAVSAAFIWRHGVLADWTSHAEVTMAFTLGVLVLGVALFVTAAFSPVTISQLTAAAVQLLLTAWAALSLAGVADASRSAADDEALPLNRYWVLAALTVVGVIFGLGLLLTSVVTPATVRGWLALLQPLTNLLGLAIYYLFYVASYLIFLVLTPLLDYIRSLQGQPPVVRTPPSSPLGNAPTPAQVATVLPPWVELILRGLAIVAILALIGFIVTWALRRQAVTDRAGVREDRDLIWSWDLVKSQLAELLARRGPPPMFAELPAGQDDPLTRVRRAYQRLLALALARGQARPPRQTPRAFLPAVQTLWPQEAGALSDLTAAYTAARYGQVPPSAEQLAAMQQAIARLDKDHPD